MLSYRHSYHAGNHADVLKHTVQSLIIESLKEKEKPFLYLDTHAGAGRYQLSSEHAERTGEYLEGIARIWQQDDLPAELEPYIGVVQHFNRSGQLRYYPGSPLIARQLLREQDSLQLTELHPSDFPLLRGEFQKDERARVAKADGYQQLKAKLPPVSRRGLILIDPPYEIKSDYPAVVTRKFKIAQCVIDRFFLCGVQSGVMIAITQIAVRLIQTFMLPNPGAVFRQQRQRLLIGFAQFRAVFNRVQVANRRENTPQHIVNFCQRLAEVFPGVRRALRNHSLNIFTAIVQRLSDGRHNVLRLNFRKRRQFEGSQQWIGH